MVTLPVFEKHQQLIHRHAPAFIRHVLEGFRARLLNANQAADQLGLSPSRLYALATAYNTARTRKQQPLWTPGTSGGNHATPWPQPVIALLKKRLACSPPCPYSFAASEALRLHHFKLDRAQVRRWALENHLAHAVPPKKVHAAVRRWQRAQIGELWQLDASPQAKGKIERAHQYWQGRLPAFFASENITEITSANPQIDALRSHRNTQEVHRELRQTPQRAWDQARKEKRSVLRPAPRCPWWNYVWSVRTLVKVGSDGRVPIGTHRLRIEKPPASKVVLCLHPSGHHSVLAAAPDPTQKPALLFTNRPA